MQERQELVKRVVGRNYAPPLEMEQFWGQTPRTHGVGSDPGWWWAFWAEAGSDPERRPLQFRCASVRGLTPPGARRI